MTIALIACTLLAIVCLGGARRLGIIFGAVVLVLVALVVFGRTLPPENKPTIEQRFSDLAKEMKRNVRP